MRRAAVISQAPGLRGMPSTAQCSSALTAASWTSSSARSQSPRMRTSAPVRRPRSSRRTSARRASTVARSVDIDPIVPADGIRRSRHNAEVTSPARRPPSTVAVVVALLTVYILWGSTYFAIAVMIETMPPLLAAGVRFVDRGPDHAGRALRPRSTGRRGSWERPSAAQWRTAAVVGTLLLLGGNGGVVLSEQFIPTGVAAVVIATVPIWLTVFDAMITRRRPGALVIGGLVAGLVGVAVLFVPVEGFGQLNPIGIGLVSRWRDLLGDRVALLSTPPAAAIGPDGHRHGDAHRRHGALRRRRAPGRARADRRRQLLDAIRSSPSSISSSSDRSPATPPIPGSSPTSPSRRSRPTPTSIRSSRWHSARSSCPSRSRRAR